MRETNEKFAARNAAAAETEKEQEAKQRSERLIADLIESRKRRRR